jgi:uncharacterized protein YuzE
MSDITPDALAKNGNLVIDLGLGAGARRVEFDGVIDLTDFGDVVGVEVLDLRQQLRGGIVSPPVHEGLPRWSYDDEIDAFYIRLLDSTAPRQQPITGTAVLDDSGRLTALEIPIQW